MPEPNTDREKLRAPRKPRRCPNCKHYPVASIGYGYPGFDEEMQRKINAGYLVLGGCIVGWDDPAWRCTRCDLEIWQELPDSLQDLLKTPDEDL